MGKERLITMSIVVFILLIAGAVILFKNPFIMSFTIKDIPSEEVAKYIGENSVLYAQAGCIHCKEQEDLFGVNVKYLNIVDCLKSENTQVCINEGIKVTPTWVINGVKYEEKKTIEELKELTGYQAK
jgi:hypothetical protein